MILVHIWNSDNNQVVVPTVQTKDEIIRLIELKCKDINYPFLRVDDYEENWVGLFNVNSCLQIIFEDIDNDKYDFAESDLCYFS